MQEFHKGVCLLLKTQQTCLLQYTTALLLVQLWHDLLAWPDRGEVGFAWRREIIERAQGNSSPTQIARRRWMVTNKDHMQDHTCITGVAVVLVHIPIAGSHMEFDGAGAGRVIPGEA